MIYKPSNCHPFASAIDITKTFLRLEKKENGEWWQGVPEAVYLTGKVETDNKTVIGYKVRLYLDGNLVFEGKKFSPFSELPKFDDDKTVNTGRNGTYFAIPFFQCAGGNTWGDDNFKTLSYNVLYSGLSSGETVEGTQLSNPNILADFLISYQDATAGVDYSGNWTYNSSTLTLTYSGSQWDGTLNGGYLVTKNDVVAVVMFDENLSSYPHLLLCTLSDKPNTLRCWLDSSVAIPDVFDDRGFLFVKKGKRAGLYRYFYNSAPVENYNLVVKSKDWSGEFYGFDATLGNFMNFWDGNLSWEVILLQGDETRDTSHETVDGSTLYYYDLLGFDTGFYDMKITSGTILGSCAKRLQLSSYFSDAAVPPKFPGEGLQSPLVLVGTFCELYDSNDPRNKLVPSFPIASFDSSFGHVYPKDGYLTQAALESFMGGVSGNLLARFYKFSSNESDILSNEKVSYYYNNLADVLKDPRAVLKPGYDIGDGSILSQGDRVLWQNGYPQSATGCYNGIWVVGASGEEPSRPADGDNWADYIGKVMLVTKGEYAGTVIESTATAGSFELGVSSLFFREQTPIQLFSGEDVSATRVREIDPYIDPLQYVRVSTIIDSTTGVITVDNVDGVPMPGIPAGEPSQILVVLNDVDYRGNPRQRVVRLSLTGDHAPQGDTSLGNITVYRSYTNLITQQQAIYFYKLFGDVIDVLGSTYESEVGPSKGLVYEVVGSELSTDTSLSLSPDINSAQVLFNGANKTYVSPATFVDAGMKMKLKNGASATLAGGSVIDTLTVNSFDAKFNCVAHAALAAPLPAATNDGVTPPTPYKYDVISCFRISDQNGFTVSPSLTPYIEPTDLSGNIIAGYSAFADVSCFQGDGDAWNSARLVLQYGDDPEKWQDTDWFHDGNLDTEFLGLEPGMEYPAIVYAKDAEGRITQSGRTIKVPEDAEDNLTKQCFYSIPTATKSAAATSNLTLNFHFRFNKESLGATSYQDLSNFSGSYNKTYFQFTQIYAFPASVINIAAIIVGASFDDAGGNKVTIGFDSPNGHHIVTATFSGTAGSTSTKCDWSTIDFVPVFTGTFSGTLTAEPDCSTQSVMLTYEPVTSYDDWPAGLPVEQNGTYDIYRREYVDLTKTYSCDPDFPENGREQPWYGDWEPVALNIGTTNVRDFNVKQGHSYQYAILPRKNAALKIEKYATDDGVEDYPTNIDSDGSDHSAFICFDNSMIGIPEANTINTLSISIKDQAGIPITLGTSKADYVGPTITGNLINGYIWCEFQTVSLHYPVTIDLTLNYLGLSYSARVIFSSATEYTVEPLNDSYGWRKRLLANGGDPVYIQWDAWSLTELDEVDPSTLFEDPTVRHPAVRKAYKADLDRIWLFRYDAEPGSQSINLTKGEISTLGKYARFSSGSLNAEGGEMSAWLGSEVVPGYRNGYIERRRSTIWAPAATNEAAAMLAAFRAMVASDKPKLLRDRKGRSWIVQVSGGSSTTMDNFVGTPTKVSFSWKEIGATDPYVVIWGDGDELPPIDTDGEWKPNIILTP